MKNGQIDAIVFDFDGTLAELTIDFAAMKRRLKALGQAFMEDLPNEDHLPVLEWIDTMSGHIRSRDESLGKEFHTRCRFLVTSMEHEAANSGRLFSYTPSILRRLDNKGIKTAIITRNSASAVRIIYPEIADMNGSFLAREDVKQVKPHPEHLLAAIRAIDVPAHRTLMVGDHPMDIETGRSAGAMSAGVASGRIDLEELGKANPDFLASNCEELMFILREKELI